MDPPQSHTLNTEGAQTLTAMTTINPQTLAPESNAFGYYQNMWNHPNNYFPSIQGGPFCYQNEGAQTVATMAMPSTQPTQSLPIPYCTERQDNLQMQFAQPLAGDMTATQLQYANSILPQGVAQGSGPRNQSERSLMKNREAAREYRRRRKAYVQGLEERVAKLENQNKALKEELKTWKEMCHHNGP
ncbi:cyclic AMP-dependent transcription factor ATF-1-like isoform X1 [Hippocampus comes]|uniref:cyclic AMP-dependent transcription factor ATF-1-like isoform X1 n=1 Tax=Hippocampus comes TaxID=109280 RepID=UPI00094F2680|nr:PREDICTED: cyclic AMP-dependent transcription factor ATF-1-like isoform X1 [Hippocampus comes]XP_051910157.1 cyclic AMP-dependent transcription factor ATF-1-like isoform X1 [Hippocampus zosterae]